MEYEKMKDMFFIPYNFHKGQKCFLNIILLYSLLSLSGCSTSVKSASLAPSPPDVSRVLFSQDNYVSYQPHFFAPPRVGVEIAIAKDTRSFENSELTINDTNALAVNGDTPVQASLKGCRFKDRFDRKAILAYEWNRSRLSLDVKGINFDSGGDKGFRVEYKIRFQPEKTKKQRCRYSSSWQGLFGSSYNEFIVREDNAAWGEIITMKEELMQYINRSF